MTKHFDGPSHTSDNDRLRIAVADWLAEPNDDRRININRMDATPAGEKLATLAYKFGMSGNFLSKWMKDHMGEFPGLEIEKRPGLKHRYWRVAVAASPGSISFGTFSDTFKTLPPVPQDSRPPAQRLKDAAEEYHRIKSRLCVVENIETERLTKGLEAKGYNGTGPTTLEKMVEIAIKTETETMNEPKDVGLVRGNITTTIPCGIGAYEWMVSEVEKASDTDL